MDLKRQSNETELDYHKRIVFGKLDDKSLSDYDYSELAPYVYGRDYSTDVARRMFYGSYRTLKMIDELGIESVSDEELAEQIIAKQLSLQRERYKLQAAKSELNNLLRHDSRFELFYDSIAEAIERIPIPEFTPIPTYSNSNSEYVLGMGDIHYGAKFDSLNNSYSRQICKHRFEVLAADLTSFIKSHEISRLHIINVADTIQGILRLSDLQINEIPVVEAVVEISRLLAQFLNTISTECELIYYHCPTANHSQIRPLGTKANEIATEDMEKIIVSYISDLLADNPRISVVSDFTHEYLLTTICGFEFVIMHGHQIKDLHSVLKDMSALLGKQLDYAILGHRHSYSEIVVGEGVNHNKEVLTCPSFVGSDPYADKLMVGNKAMCKLFEFDSVCGHIGTSSFILN